MAPPDMEKEWTVYLLHCTDDTYYCGTCLMSRLEQRVQEHNRGTGSRYTRSRIPVRLLVHSPALSKVEAYRLEYQTKQQPRGQKIRFLTGI